MRKLWKRVTPLCFGLVVLFNRAKGQTPTSVPTSSAPTTLLEYTIPTSVPILSPTPAPTTNDSEPTPASTPEPITSAPTPLSNTPSPTVVLNSSLPVVSPMPVPTTVAPTPEGVTLSPVPTPVETPAPPSRVTPATVVTVQITPKDYIGCMKVDGPATTKDDSLLFATCVGPPEPRSQLFEFADGNRIRPANNLNKCVTGGDLDAPATVPRNLSLVYVSDCDDSNTLQKFSFDTTNGGPMTLLDYPDYCVAFVPETATLDDFPIRIVLCESVPYMINGWEIKK